RGWRKPELDCVNLADVRARAPGVHAVDAIDGETVAHEEREPAFAAVGRRVIYSRTVAATGIEQDRVFIGQLGRILVGGVDVVDRQLAWELASGIEASAIGRAAVDDLTSSLNAA